MGGRLTGLIVAHFERFCPGDRYGKASVVVHGCRDEMLSHSNNLTNLACVEDRVEMVSYTERLCRDCG